MRYLCKMVMGLSLVMAVTVGAAEEGGWNWGLSPYGWMAGMEGDVAIGPVESDQLLPHIAAIMPGSSAVNRPICMGSPASSA